MAGTSKEGPGPAVARAGPRARAFAFAAISFASKRSSSTLIQMGLSGPFAECRIAARGCKPRAGSRSSALRQDAPQRKAQRIEAIFRWRTHRPYKHKAPRALPCGSAGKRICTEGRTGCQFRGGGLHPAALRLGTTGVGEEHSSEPAVGLSRFQRRI